MTLVIGARCTDGIILISDRKIVDTQNNRAYLKDKILNPIENYPFAASAAGVVSLFDRFNRSLPIKVSQRMREFKILNEEMLKRIGKSMVSFETNPVAQVVQSESIDSPPKPQDIVEKEPNIELPYQYSVEHFLMDCTSLVKEICDSVPFSEPLSVLLAVKDSIPKLYSVDENGLESEEVGYKAIGSGKPFADMFFSKIWNPSWGVIETAKLACFVIYLIERMELDTFVGVGNTLPNIYVILEDGRFGYLNINDSENWLKEIENKIKSVENLLTGFTF